MNFSDKNKKNKNKNWDETFLKVNLTIKAIIPK